MRLRVVVGLLTIGSLFASCGGQDDRTDPATSASPEPTTATEPSTSRTAATDPALAQLCGVLNAALAGELDVVRSTFDHGPLHTLADAAIDVDRGVAARLLEAKEAVESDLADPATAAATVAADLEALTTATAAALNATGTAVPPTCDQENP